MGYSTPVRTQYGLYSLIRYALPKYLQDVYCKDALMLLYMYYLRSYHKIKQLEEMLKECHKIGDFDIALVTDMGVQDIAPELEKDYLDEVETLLEDIEECHAATRRTLQHAMA